MKRKAKSKDIDRAILAARVQVDLIAKLHVVKQLHGSTISWLVNEAVKEYVDKKLND